MGFVFASDNSTEDIALVAENASCDVPILENENIVLENNSDLFSIEKSTTQIQSKDVNSYYKENVELVAFLKDENNRPISNKKVSILVNNKLYDKLTDNSGKVVLKLTLNPGTYTAKINFDGDENYTASSTQATIKISKATMSIAAKNYKTYWHSNLFFKAKIINKVTKNPVKGIKVCFKVYTTHNKYKIYYATTDNNGVAKLRKNFKVGAYKVVTFIKNKNVKSKKVKSTLTVKPTAETGCTSLYVQVSKNEAVAGFRRDATNAVNLHIIKYKLNGKSAIKQYKKGSYFFHSITSADGWMAGTGGIDNPGINHAIEKLVGKMFKAGEIKKSYLKKIQGYEQILGLGHFSIKAPNGKYAVVWGSGIIYGKLKPGEYFKAPNARSLFHHGNYKHFSKNPAKAAIKIAATDSFGVNRRDATAFHWKTTTTEGKTTATLKVYAANDNGNLVGRSTGHLKDDIYFIGKFVSRNKLPKTPSSKYLGKYEFGSIDKLIKTQTTVKVPKLTQNLNQSKTFDITVKDKKTKNAIKNLKIKIKIKNKVYTVKTNSRGIAVFNPKSLGIGTYNIKIYSGNLKYYVSAKSTIKIT